MPTTIVPASLGIWAQSTDAAAFADAMYATPAGMLLDAFFLWSWRVFPRALPAWPLPARLGAVTSLSLTLWFVGATATVVVGDYLRDLGVPMVIFGVGLTAGIAVFGLYACRGRLVSPPGTRRVGLPMLLSRGLLAGACIGVAVWLAGVAGPLAAGIASVFPAIFVTTMVALWISQGEAVQAGAVGPMMLGSTSVAVYALFAAWTFPVLGPGPAAAVSWIGAVGLATVPAWLYLRR